MKISASKCCTTLILAVIRATTIGNGNKLFAFGQSNTRYDLINSQLIGIPVHNNGIPGVFYQDNLDNDAGLENPLTDGFGFSLCLNGTPLGVDPDFGTEQSNKLELFPNPILSGNSKVVHISCEYPIEQYAVYSLEGKVLQSGTNVFGAKRMELLLPDLATGVYSISAGTSYGRSMSQNWL